MSKLQFLLVEDNDIQQMIAKKRIETAGILVTVAGNGTDALEKAKNNFFDLIFMDIGLPDMDGIEVTAAIRKLPSPYGQVPIVALTANIDEEIKEKGLAVGMNEYFNKPLSNEMIDYVIEHVVKQKN